MKLRFVATILLFSNLAMANYIPTLISKDTAVHVFEDMNEDYIIKGKSADSAYLWAYEAYNTHGIQSEKMFIHYTKAFNHIISNKRITPKCFLSTCYPELKGWEFHVTNLFNVEGEMMAFDKAYFSEPISKSEWATEFTKHGENFLNQMGDQYIDDIKEELGSSSLTKKERQILESELSLLKSSKNPITGKYEIKCKEVQKIETHFAEEQTAWCHTQVTDMYAWNQRDLAEYDPVHPYPEAPKNKKKTSFKIGILKAAYNQVGKKFSLRDWLYKN